MRLLSLAGSLIFVFASRASAQDAPASPEQVETDITASDEEATDRFVEGPEGLTEPTPSPDASYVSNEGDPADVPPPPDDSTFGSSRYPSGLGTAADDADLQIPSRIATRLRVLDADFAYLAARGGNHIVDGVLSIVSGGLSVSLGFIIGEDDDLLRNFLLVFGGASIVRGVIDLILDPDASDVAIEYGHMPMTTLEDVNDRLRFGETELESLADMSRLSRILDASINIASGLAFIPLYLGPNDFEVDTFGAIVLVGAGVSVVTGIISLFTTTEAERRWDAYDELRDRLEGNGDEDDGETAESSDDEDPEGDPGFDAAAREDQDLEASFGVAPSGASVSIGARF
jgi:hypothetical protein